MPTRKEQAAMAKKKIVESAIRLIKEKGYDDIRIADITSACGMTPGNFYHYYKSKDDLFSEIDMNHFYQSMSALKADNSAPVSDRLISYIMDWIELMISYYGAHYTLYWFHHYIGRQFSANAENDRINIISGHVLSILEKGVKDGELREDTPVECIAFTVAYSIIGSTAHFGVDADEDFVRRWANEYCQIYIRKMLEPYRCSVW